MNGLSDVRLTLHSQELERPFRQPATRPSAPPNLGFLALLRHRWITRQQLRELTPDQLRDIGLSEKQAREESLKPFWRE